MPVGRIISTIKLNCEILKLLVFINKLFINNKNLLLQISYILILSNNIN